LSKKKPDLVVYDDNDGYNASALSYPTSVGAPQIDSGSIALWRTMSVNKVNKELKASFAELKEQYERLIQEYKWNELVYSARFNFEPMPGEEYHLYVGDDGEPMLSILAPNDWNRQHLGSFRLDTKMKWNKIA